MEKVPAIKSRDIQYLYTEIAKIMTATLDATKVIDAMMEEVQRFFHPRNWSFLRLDPQTNELFFVVAKGLDQELIQHVHLKVGEGIAGYVAQTGKSKYVKDVTADPYFSPSADELSGFKTRSVIAVPVRFHNTVLGVIELVNTEACRPFSRREFAILETIADFSAIALTNSMQYENMKMLAIVDPLTGLLNRARLEKLFISFNVEVIEDEEKEKSQIICIFVDVNHLKKINDTNGHRAGDEMLVQVGNILKKFCRESDLVFRIGGDEFLIVINDVAKSAVSHVIQRWEETLAPYAKANEKTPSFSYGITTGDKSRIRFLISEADRAMYNNKKKHSDQL